MARMLVTGVAGFTGRHLCQHLAGLGHEVHGLVHMKPGQPVEGASALHEADIADLAAMRQIIAEVQPEKVVHLAAVAFVAHGDIEALYRSNVVGTRQLLEALADQPDKLSSVLLASSANIYGNSQAGVLDESLAPSPANDYGVSKVAAELIGQLYGNRLPLVIARPFNYTGRGQQENFIIPKIIAHAMSREAVIELGNLEVSRDFSDVRAVVDAYARLLDEPRAIGGTFNVCSGKAVSLREILNLVQQVTGHSLEVRINPAFVRSDEVRSLKGSSKRIESVIGPLLHIGLEETIKWMSEN